MDSFALIKDDTFTITFQLCPNIYVGKVQLFPTTEGLICRRGFRVSGEFTKEQ